MLLFTLLINLIETSLTLDFLPNPFEPQESTLKPPQVAFQPRKFSKYFDLAEQEWKDSGESFKQYFHHRLQFCQEYYGNGVVQLTQARALETLQFCSIKNRTKCSYKETSIWLCEEATPTEPTAMTPASTVLPIHKSRSCVDETIRHISYPTCTAISTVVMDGKHCSKYNQTFNNMDNVVRCNLTYRDEKENGLLSADMKCCSKEDRGMNDFTLPTDTLGPQLPDNPFQSQHNPFYPPKSDSPCVSTPDVPVVLPKEWCGLDQIEKKRENMTAVYIVDVKKVYNLTAGDMDEAVIQIGYLEKALSHEVAELYDGHYTCLVETIQSTVTECSELFEQYCKAGSLKTLTDRSKAKFDSDIKTVRDSLSEVNATFENMKAAQPSDFTSEYRSVVIKLRELRQKIDSVREQLQQVENCVECGETAPTQTNEVESPSNEGGNEVRVVDKPSGKLGNQKFLIAIVAAVSGITILVALVFFILVVRRTLQKDMSRRFTNYPASDITNEAYVAFLQKNGYANPTCRLPQKYLDDHD